MKKYFHRFNTQQEQNDFVTLADGQTITSNDSYYEPYVGINKENKGNVGFNKEYSIKLTNERTGKSWKLYKLIDRIPESGNSIINTSNNTLKATKVEIGRCVKTLGDSFITNASAAYRTDIKKVSFHYGLETITGSSASSQPFLQFGIEEFNPPLSLKIIKQRALRYCSSLKKMNLPFNTDTDVWGEGEPINSYNNNLEEIHIDKLNPYITDMDGSNILVKKVSATERRIVQMAQKSVFPEGVTHFSNYLGSRGLAYSGGVELPKSLVNIGAAVFNTNQTKYIIIKKDNGLQSAHNRAFALENSTETSYPFFVPDDLYGEYINGWLTTYINRDRIHPMSEFETFKNNGYEFPEQSGE